MSAKSEKQNNAVLSSPLHDVNELKISPNGDLNEPDEVISVDVCVSNDPSDDIKKANALINGKPSFFIDKLWAEYKMKFPWLYFYNNRFLCFYCEEAYKLDKGMVSSCWTAGEAVKVKATSSNHYIISRIRFERHGQSHNHCLAATILNKSSPSDDWLSLKEKYPWLEGDLSNTRCSLCEEAYKKHKQSMIVTIWTCPGLNNQQSPTHFSVAHKLDRHEKCKNHLLAAKLENGGLEDYKISPVKVGSDITSRTRINRHASLSRLSGNNNRTKISRFSGKSPQYNLSENVRRSRKSAPVKSSCKQLEIVLPRTVTIQQFETLKLRFPWLIDHDDTSFGCDICNEEIKFERNLSISTISQIVFSHLHKSDLNDANSRSTRLRTGLKPKVDYKLLSTGMPDVKVKKERKSEKVDLGPWSCPQCKSHFQHNLSLIEHISLCDNQSTDVIRELSCPCHPHMQRFHTITKLDLHAAQDHANQPLFHCYICSDRHCRLLGLYEHMIVHHLIDWDPFDTYVSHGPSSPSSECIFCCTNLTTNAELTNHYCQSNCNKFLQPAVVVEEILKEGEVSSADKVLSQRRPKSKRRKLAKIGLEEIKTDITEELSKDTLDKNVVPVEENKNLDSGSEAVNQILTVNPNKEAIENGKEDVNEKFIFEAENRIENVPENCIENVPGNINEKCAESGEDKSIIKDLVIVPENDEPKIDIVLQNTEIKDNVIDTVGVSEVQPVNNQELALPKVTKSGNEISTESLEPVEIEKGKRLRAPSEKFKENTRTFLESEKKKRGKKTPEKVDECVKEPTEMRKRARVSLDTLKDSLVKRRRRFEKPIEDDPFDGLIAVQNEDKGGNPSCIEVDSSKIALKKDNVSNQSVQRLCLIRKSQTNRKKSENNTTLTEVPNKLVPESISKESCQKFVGLSINVVESEAVSLPHEIMKSKKPIMIQSQVSPPGRPLIMDSNDEENIITSQLSFMDRMKKIRQLKKNRTEHQREQMMRVDETVAEICEKGRRKAEKLKKVLNSENNGQDCMRKRLSDSIKQKVSRKPKLNLSNTSKLESPRSSKVESPTSSKLVSPKVNKTPKDKAKLFICDICQEKFRSLRARDQHVVMEHKGAKIFSCNICHISRSTHYALRKHALKSHPANASFAVFGDEKQVNIDFSFQCNLCSLQFTSQSGMKHHITSTHRNDSEKQTPLKDSEVKPNDSDEFVNSLKEANPMNAPQECPVCNEIMNNGLELAIHVIEHQREADNNIEANQFACPKCCRLFFGREGKTYLKDHYNMVHLRKPNPFCDDCKTVFTSTWCYYEHKRIMKNCMKKTVEQMRINDPYEELNDELRLAFVCSRCQTLVAGETAIMRFEQHQTECSQQLADDFDSPSTNADS